MESVPSTKSSDSSFSSSASSTHHDDSDHVSVQATSHEASDVQTRTPEDSGHDERRVTGDTGAGQHQETVSTSVSSRPESLSPTLSAESLLSDDVASDTISLGDAAGAVTDSEDIVQSSQQTVATASSSSSTPSIVLSVPSMSSVSSNPSSSSILPSAPTTQAPDEVVTTNPLSDEELEEPLYHTHELKLMPGDYRAAQPSTVKITPTTPSTRMMMTTPTYHRANPNRMGILDGETEDDEDHFLSLKAPLTSEGGPVNQARSSVDGLASEARTVASVKSNRRAEPSPGPDISDILSGLLNVVGEGLSIATNYVQENNKKKLQEKLSSQELLDAEDDIKKRPVDTSAELEDETSDDLNDLKKNITRINNRGPPLLSNIPFEAIPLEILKNRRPGARPGVAIPQRPFQTRLPPGISGPPPTITSPQVPGGAPYKVGVTLPEQLVPGDPTAPTNTGAAPDQLPTRPDYTPDFSSPSSGEVSDELVDRVDKLPTVKPSPGSTSTRKNVLKKKPTQPPLKPVSTDPFIDLLLNEIKEGRITTAPPPPRRQPTTSQPPAVEIEPSFTPPLLVTPPTTPRARPQPPNRRPWGGGNRPPRPQGPPPPSSKYPVPDWKYQNKPPSSYPTPPLNTKPFVFPTNRYRGPPGAVVTGVAIPADNDVFDLTVTAQQNYAGRPRQTGVAVPANNDVFDLTVTAQQNFGGSRKTNKFQGNFINL